MSAFNEIDVTCAQCGEEFKGTVWTAIHAAVDPELKGLLLGGELNILFCPKCAHTFFYEHFLLYQDPRIKLVAYVYPAVEEPHKDELGKMMLRGFDEAQATFDPKERLPYGPELFFGLDTLQKRVRADEDRLVAEEVAEAHRRSAEATDD